MVKLSPKASAPKARTRVRANTSAQLRSVLAPTPAAPLPPLATARTPKLAPVDKDLVEAACGLVNPFCPEARGSKYPDDSSVRTLPFTLQQEAVLGSDGAGFLGAFVLPTIAYSPLVTAAVAAPQINATFLDAPVVPVLTGTSKFRIVSMGYKLRNIAPALTASGMISIRTFSQEDGSSGITSTSGNTYSASGVQNIALTNLVDQLVNVPHTSQMPQTFYDPSVVSPTNLINDWMAPGFCYSTIYGAGLPLNTDCIHIEIIIHLELMFEEGAALQLAAGNAPTANPILKQIAASVSSSASHIFSESVSEFGTYVKKTIVRAILDRTNSTPRGRFASASYYALTNGGNVD